MWQNQMKQTKSCDQKLSSKSAHGFAECQNDCRFLDYLSDYHSDYHSDSIQQFSLLEKLSKSDKSYFIMSNKIYSKCMNLELTLKLALC